MRTPTLAKLFAAALAVCVALSLGWPPLAGRWAATHPPSAVADCATRVANPIDGSGENSTSGSDDGEISVLVFTHSHPGRESRLRQREFCRPLYEREGVAHVFAVGRPSYDPRGRDDHVQGQLATGKEIAAAKRMMEEHERYGDILVTPNRDHYRDLSEKLLSSLRYAVGRGVDLILKTDDEYCVDVTLAKSLVRERRGNGEEIYMGWYKWEGTEYDIMKGADGTVAPFMSGAVFGLSRELARTIVEEGWVRSMMYAVYGTCSDDANLGRWIDWARRERNVTVDYVADRNLMIEIPAEQRANRTAGRRRANAPRTAELGGDQLNVTVGHVANEKLKMDILAEQGNRTKGQQGAKLPKTMVNRSLS